MPNAATEAPPEGQPPSPPPAVVEWTSRIDWAHVAQLLARGHTIPFVADAIGCARTTIWRALKQSNGLRRRLAEEQAKVECQVGARLYGLQPLVADLLEQRVRQGDVRVALWLAKNLGMLRQRYPTAPVLTQDQQRAAAADEKTVVEAALIATIEWDDPTAAAMHARAVAPAAKTPADQPFGAQPADAAVAPAAAGPAGAADPFTSDADARMPPPAPLPQPGAQRGDAPAAPGENVVPFPDADAALIAQGREVDARIHAYIAEQKARTEATRNMDLGLDDAHAGERPWEVVACPPPSREDRLAFSKPQRR